MVKRLLLAFLFLTSCFTTIAQHSVARRWNEVMLSAIRQDLARPPVQARNLFHMSVAMYDTWAAYSNTASTYLLGKTINGITYPFSGIQIPANVELARDTAISYAAYRILYKRYANSPNWGSAKYRFDTLMANLGYDTSYHGVDYVNGNAADLGNYVASQILAMGLADGAHEAQNYANQFYAPVNSPLVVAFTGNPNFSNINRWQPLTINSAQDQAGNPIPSTQVAVCPEWGLVVPFAMSMDSAAHYFRNGNDYPVYYDPGPPPMLDTVDANSPDNVDFKWGHTMVASWSSHLDPDDTTMMDISPASIGNVPSYPSNFTEAHSFYNFTNGGSTGTGYSVNPVTGMPYTPQLVKRGDYTRVLSQFWADGPASETPPGHWYTILNYVGDYPGFQKKLEGVGPVLPDLEWDVKTYLALGGAVHDAAIACWGIKGWYDSPRPISAIRKMALYGQSSDSTLPHYHPAGLPLIPGFIELIEPGDSMEGPFGANVNKIKMRAWKGFTTILNPATDYAGVGWILAENWMPYQRKTFVTPPFAGYVSGHSTYSRAGAFALTLVTGSPYFPGGMGEFSVPANSGFLVFEKGPSTDIHLQWAKYIDASDEASLSRIWGSIHPPFDDFYGRKIGEKVGTNSFLKAKNLFNGFALPAQILSFNAHEESCLANITWSTTSEKNIASYKIYRSHDGKNFNELIGMVNATNKSETINNYSFVDKSPLPINFYKIIENDFDHSELQSPIVKLNLSHCFTNEAIVVGEAYPNPASELISIDINTQNLQEDIDIRITDITGRVSKISSESIQQGQNQVNINIHDLPKGQYVMNVVLLNGARYSRKFTKF